MDLGIPELTDEQFEEVTQIAEDAARKHIFLKVNQKQVENLTVSVEAEGTKPVNFEVEVDLSLVKKVNGIDENELAKEAVKAAFDAVDSYLRKLK